MSNALRRTAAALLGGLALAANAPATSGVPPALSGINPDRLSGASYLRLYEEGAFGGSGTPRRAHAAYPDVGKGRPPAVLDARIGANLRLLDDPDALPATQRGQAEPYVYRSAVNPDVLLATFQDGRFADAGALGNGYSVSRDGGLTWTRAPAPNFTLVSGGGYFRATDPVAAIGAQGDFYLSGLGALDNSFNTSALVLQRSTDQGATWSSPIVVFQSGTAQVFADKNWLAVNDLPATATTGRLVATWTSFTSTANNTSLGHNIVASASNDRGATWTAPINVTPTSASNQGSQPVFLPDGSLGIVYITFLNPNDVTQFSIDFKRSPDGGFTYPAAATSVVPSVAGWDDPEMRDGVFLPAAIAARQTGEIFVTYTAVVTGSPRVMFTKSADRGATWTPPLAISDQPAGISVMNPAIAASPDGRTLAVVFMDKRHAPGGRGFVDHTVAWSFDGGATWQPNVRLTEMSSDIRYGPATPRGVMLGDYLAVAAAPTPDQPWVAIWCDTRTGDSDPFTVRFTPAAAPSFDTWRVARFGRSELNDAAVSGAAADFDRDGVSNLVEFDQGTDPRVPEDGETLVVNRTDADTLDVAAAGRAETPNTTFSAAEVPAVPPAPGQPQPVPNTLFTPGPGASPPSVSPRDGLVWRTARFSGVAGNPMALTRSSMQVTTQPAPPPQPGTVTAVTFGGTNESATSATNARLINVATRGRVGPGTSQMIVGFVLNGNKTILVRAAGPALAQFGVSGTLADPRLTLTALASDLDVTNDNWRQGTATRALFARLGAFPFADASADSALLLSVGPQSYTAIAAGGTASPGIALVEAYDADAIPGDPTKPRLLNLSTRGEVGTGDNALVAGFIISGTQPRRMLIRAVGPGLAIFSITGALSDPLLTLYRGQTRIAVNDDWERSRSGEAIAATSQRVGAFALSPASLDAALLITLAPGSYTAVVSGVGGATGIALVEVYDAD